MNKRGEPSEADAKELRQIFLDMNQALRVGTKEERNEATTQLWAMIGQFDSRTGLLRLLHWAGRE